MSAEVALLDYAFPFLLIGLFSKGCVRKGCEPKRDWGLRDGSGNWYFHSLLESHHGRIDDTRLRQHPDSSAAICQSFKRNELTPPPLVFVLCSVYFLSRLVILFWRVQALVSVVAHTNSIPRP